MQSNLTVSYLSVISNTLTLILHNPFITNYKMKGFVISHLFKIFNIPYKYLTIIYPESLIKSIYYLFI